MRELKWGLDGHHLLNQPNITPPGHFQTKNTFHIFHEAVRPSGKALGWEAEGFWFDSALALLSLQKLGTLFLSLIINEPLKWLLPQPILMQNHSGGDSVAL